MTFGNDGLIDYWVQVKNMYRGSNIDAWSLTDHTLCF